MAVTNLVLSLILVQYYGVLGVILGTVIPFYVFHPLYLNYGLKLIGVVRKNFVKKVLLTTYPLAGAVAVALLSVRHFIEPRNLIEVGFLGLFGLFLFWGMFYLFSLEKHEKEQMKRYILGFFRTKDRLSI